MSQHFNLTEPETGFHGLITEINGDPVLKRKLLSLGLRKGQVISILHQRHNGVVIFSNGNRVALGSKIASQVVLKALDGKQRQKIKGQNR